MLEGQVLKAYRPSNYFEDGRERHERGLWEKPGSMES